MGDINAYKILVRTHEGKRPLERPRNRCEDVDWLHVVQDTDQWRDLVKMVINLWVL